MGKLTPERLRVIAWHRWLVLLPVLTASAIVMLTMAWPVLAPSATPDILAAYATARNGDWTGALAVAKNYVFDHPDDPVGHFLLGQCYLYGDKVQLTIASGELETALDIHNRTKSLGAWSGTMDADEFKFRLYKVRAVVELRIVRESITYQLPLPFVRRHLLAGIDQVKRGLELKPDDAKLKDMDEAMRKLLEDLRITPPPQSAPDPATGAHT